MSVFDLYAKYVGESEAPSIYHRWCCCSMLSALMEQQIYIPFGHGSIYPNQYLILMGPPATRKGTAMNISKKLLRKLNYKKFAPNRTSPEKFLSCMQDNQIVDLMDGMRDDVKDLSALCVDNASAIYVLADEFQDFIGPGGMNFMILLTNLWDNLPEYQHPKLHGKDVVVDRPLVNLIAGSTAQSLLSTIPVEALGNGFMSRILFIYAEPPGIKITWPEEPDLEIEKSLLQELAFIKENLKGPITISKEARVKLDRIYKKFIPIKDPRFVHYSGRRFIHVLKIAMVFAVAKREMTITEEAATKANTLLHFSELYMPKALGEFGKSKYSDVTHMILEALNKTVLPMNIKDLMKLVGRDIQKVTDLGEIIKNLLHQDRIQLTTINGKQGYMPLHQIDHYWDDSLLDLPFLKKLEEGVL